MLTDELTTLIDETARGIARAYRVEFEDARQEMWAWALDHEQMVDRNLAPDNPEGDWRVRRALWNAGKRFGLREKAERLGYSLDDLYFYEVGQIESLLPYALGRQSLADQIMATPPEDRVARSASLPNEGNNFIVLVADVGAVVNTLPPADREFLHAALANSLDWEAVAQETALAPKAASGRYKRLLKRIQTRLGGRDPWAGRDRTGSRRAISNEKANNMTRLERDGVA